MTHEEWWCTVSFHPDELRHEAYARKDGTVPGTYIFDAAMNASDDQLREVTEWIMHDERLWDLFTTLIVEGFEWKFGGK